MRTCSALLSTCGPVRTCFAPEYLPSVSTRAATAATSRWSITAVGAMSGPRTTPPRRSCPAHPSVLEAIVFAQDGPLQARRFDQALHVGMELIDRISLPSGIL